MVRQAEYGRRTLNQTDEGEPSMADASAEQSTARRSLDSLLEGGWLLIAVLLPLWVNFWSDQPFELSKVLLFRSLVWLLAGLWMVDQLVGRRGAWLTLRRNPLFAPVVILAGAVVLATAFALDPGLSLAGSYVRGQGMLTYLSYILLFLIVTTRLRTLEQAHRLVTAMVVTAAPVILLGVLQGMGWDPLGMVSDARSPIYATLGRANFVGVYLAQLLPLTLAMALLTQEGSRRWLLLLAGGQLIVVAWTLTRGAWLASATGLILFGLLWVWPRLPRRLSSVVVATGAVGVLVASALGGLYLTGAESGSILARRAIWATVWGLIRERPILGYGPDALEIAFQRVYPPQLVYYQGREVFVDRAHNLLLDWAVTAGAVGVISFAFLFARFFATGCKRAAVAAGKRRILLAAGLASVAANVAGNLAGFDVTATATVTWLLMALVASPAMVAPGLGDEPAQASASMQAGPRMRWVLSSVLLVALLFAVVRFSVRPLLASGAHRAAVRYAGAGEVVRAVDAAKQAVAYGPWQPEHHRLLGQLLWRQAEGSGDLAVWAQAEVALQAARDLRPLDYAGWAWLGDFYGAIGAQLDPAGFALAHEAYGQAVTLVPHRARLYVAWGQIHLLENRPEAALERFVRAVDLDATDDLAYRLIGDVALALGDPERALAAYQEAVGWAPEAALAHLGLARSYAALGQPSAARSALDRSLALEPDHPAILAVQQEFGMGP
jgi:O-antigen ligase/tetratricopeptide (TPR) repeat protein